MLAGCALSVLAIGASLLGGMLGRKSEKRAVQEQNEYNHPVNVRKRAEEAGFNPALFVGPGVGNQTAVAGSNYFGSALADSALMLADDLQAKRQASQVTKVTAENAKLQEQVKRLTLRPDVGGIYGRSSTPTLLESLGHASRADTSDPLRDPVQLVDGVGGGVAVPDARLDRGSGAYFAGERIESAPGWSPANVAENEWGDVGQALYGLGKMGSDVVFTIAERKRKRDLQPMTFGAPLRAPFGFVDRTPELLPGDYTSPRATGADRPRLYSGRGSRGMPQPFTPKKLW